MRAVDELMQLLPRPVQKSKAGIVWPEELDATRYLALTNTLGLELNASLA